MDLRAGLSALGVGIASFVIVAVFVIELLDFEFSALIGLPVGLLAGVGVFVLALSRYETLTRVRRAAVDAGAGFGLGIVLLLGAAYVNLANLAFEWTVGTAVVLGLLAGIGSWVAGQPTSLE